MNVPRLIGVLAKSLPFILFAFPLSIQAQPMFQNLDFDSATVHASGLEPYGTFVPIGSALPGWTAYLGTEELTQVGYNSPTLGTATISVIGPNWNGTDASRFGIDIIGGSESVDLQTGANPYYSSGVGPLSVGASIEQNGTIPTTAESLQFQATVTTSFSVSFNGNALNPIALSSAFTQNGLPYTSYAANIAPWAGQTGELEFTANSNGSDNFVVLDDITFSAQAVPEPNTWELILSVVAMFGLQRRKRRAMAVPS
jgi:hypothetical protein